MASPDSKADGLSLGPDFFDAGAAIEIASSSAVLIPTSKSPPLADYRHHSLDYLTRSSDEPSSSAVAGAAASSWQPSLRFHTPPLDQSADVALHHAHPIVYGSFPSGGGDSGSAGGWDGDGAEIVARADSLRSSTTARLSTGSNDATYTSTSPWHESFYDATPIATTSTANIEILAHRLSLDDDEAFDPDVQPLLFDSSKKDHFLEDASPLPRATKSAVPAASGADGGEGGSLAASQVHDIKQLVPHRTRGLVIAGLLLFVSAIEYGLVFPSLLKYLQSLGEDRQYFFGIVLASFNIAQMLCSPFVGWLSDHTSVKTILMVTLAVNVVGNLVYFAAQGAWMVLLGRIVAGMGACSGVVMSYVVRVTAESERTSTITKVIAAQEAGLLIGPSLAFIIQYCDFDIGPFPVTPLTSPGLLMVIVLCVSILVVAIWFVNPPSAHYIESVLNGQSGDTKPASSPDPMAQSAPPKDVSSSSQSAFSQLKARGHLKDALREIAQLHIATIFLAQFVLLFNQSTLETIVTLLTDKFYHWGQTNNSLMYMVIAATFILIYIFIHAVNHRIQDRYLIVVGLILETATFVFDMIILPNATDLPMYQFVLACGLFICGLPFFMIAVPALFSKLTSKRRQGLLQGLLQVCTSLGCICGPLWGGSSFNRFELMFGVMLAPMSLLIVMFLLSFRKLAPPPLLVSGSNALFEHDDDDDDASTTPDERRHLIN